MKIKLNELEYGVSGIYKINFPNGKSYIGQSIDIKRRMLEHNTPSTKKQACDLAINKHGRVFEIEILDLVNCKGDLDIREKYWIEFYDTTNREKGYNISTGGQEKRSSNGVFSEEEVLSIRKRKFAGERKRDVYQNYQDRSFRYF